MTGIHSFDGVGLRVEQKKERRYIASARFARFSEMERVQFSLSRPAELPL